MKNGVFDVFVIGGGINGAGIARDAAGRGLSVALCEKGDLGEGTSSRSGKLIHGGLRYLEYYEFRLVREALTEREVLLKNSPHIVWPLRFVLPHSPEQRPAWLIRMGLFLYDHLGGRKILPKSWKLDLKATGKGSVLKDRFKVGFEFSDCWVDDSRMVVLNAMDAREKGAAVLTRTEFTKAWRGENFWEIETRNPAGETRKFQARCLINAAGPWVEPVIAHAENVRSAHKIRLVKGSHLVVRKFWEGDHCFLFQNTDKRVIFAVPCEENLALIGTTDIPYEGKPDDAAIGESEKEYLLEAVGRYLQKPLGADQIVHAFSGVRPLFDDGAGNPSAVTRDYLFEIDDADGKLPMMSVFGGKITTFRELSERALQKLLPYFPQAEGDWTANAPLPGGDIPNGDFEPWIQGQCEKHRNLPEKLVRHYGRLYGTMMENVLANVRNEEELGLHFGGLFYRAEAEYLMQNEWAKTPEDILERRTKHGLRLSEREAAAFRDWFFLKSEGETLGADNESELIFSDF